MCRARLIVLFAALGLGGCSLIVDFDRSLLVDAGVDGGFDGGLDARIDESPRGDDETVAERPPADED